MVDDPLRQLADERSARISRHDELRATEAFVAQTTRLQRLTEGIASGLHAIWLMSTRNRRVFDEFLTLRFIDDTVQSVVAIWSLAKEGQLTAAKREMRYMLESCLKHVYVDLIEMGKPLSEKLLFIENSLPKSSINFIDGFRLYKFSDTQNKEFMDSVKSTYSVLCRYVHRSPEQIEEALRLLKQGISPAFETAQELESFNRNLAGFYDLILVMHFNALGKELTGDVFSAALDDFDKWPYHKTKFVKLLSSYFNYKQERGALTPGGTDVP